MTDAESPPPARKILTHPLVVALTAALITGAFALGAAAIESRNGGDLGGVLVSTTPIVVVSTLAVPGPTSTVPGPTVTETVNSPASSTPDPIAPESVHLADGSQTSLKLLVGTGSLQFVSRTGVDIDGKTFDSGWIGPSSDSSPARIAIGINANQAYTRFRVRLGVYGNSSNQVGRLAVIADGKTICDAEVSLTRSMDCDVSVGGIQRIEIKKYPSRTGEITYAAGDPTLE